MKSVTVISYLIQTADFGAGKNPKLINPKD